MQPFSTHHTLRRGLALVVLAGAVGCSTFNPNRGYTTWRFVDPPQRSIEPSPQKPATQPTPQPEPAAAPDAAPTPTYESNKPSSPASQPVEPPETTIRQKLDAPAPGPSLGGPAGNSRAAIVEVLGLKVNAPATVQAGEPIEYAITLSNGGPTGLKDVVLECELGDGLEFPGSTERRVRRPLGAMAGGATQTLPLALTPLKEGQHCVVFRLSAEGQLPVTRDVCVRVEPSPVELQIVGPAQREVGQRAEFVLTIHNRSGRALSDARVQVRHDSALAAREASAGVERADGLLTWNLDTLQKDERIQIQMEFECLEVQPRACASVRITTAETATAKEACVDIRPTGAGLTLSLADSVDPVAVGENCVYQLVATNRGNTAISEWSVDLGFSDAVTLESAQITKPMLATPQRQPTADGHVQLTALPPLAAGESVQIDLTMRAVRDGRVDLQATVRSGATTVSTIEPTQINPPATAKP